MAKSVQDDRHDLEPLLERSRTGNREAIDLLLGKLRPYVHLLVRAVAGSDMSRGLENSDLVQETLLRIYLGFPDFVGAGAPEFLAWIGRIAHNVVASDARFRHAARRDSHKAVPGAKVFASMPGTDSSPSAQLGREDEAMRICLAIEQLSADDRNVILWRFFDQLGFGEIAERTGRREGTVRQSCLRAVEKLRTIMESAQ